MATYFHSTDADVLPVLENTADIVRRFHGTATFKVLGRYANLDGDVQDSLTAALSRLLCRMETMGSYQAGEGRAGYATALHHLRGAWYLDHFHRDFAGRGLSFEHPHALHDAFMAESVLRLLETEGRDTRVVVACHNVHIQKTPITQDGATGLPLGHRLADALGDDYVAIAATSNGGRTARMRMNFDQPMGFEVIDSPLPPAPSGSAEAAFTRDAPLTVINLRAARRARPDLESVGKMRMEDYFLDVPVFDAFDGIAVIAETSCTEYSAGERPTPMDDA